MEIMYPLLLISDIKTNIVQNDIEKKLPLPENCKLRVHLYVESSNGIVYWTLIGLTNEFLTLLMSYGIEYTYYVSKGNIGEIDREALLNYDKIIQPLIEKEAGDTVINTDDYIVENSGVLEAFNYIQSILQKENIDNVDV